LGQKVKRVYFCEGDWTGRIKLKLKEILLPPR
jgi:hypothetical protein